MPYVLKWKIKTNHYVNNVNHHSYWSIMLVLLQHVQLLQFPHFPIMVFVPHATKAAKAVKDLLQTVYPAILVCSWMLQRTLVLVYVKLVNTWIKRQNSVYHVIPIVLLALVLIKTNVIHAKLQPKIMLSTPWNFKMIWLDVSLAVLLVSTLINKIKLAENVVLNVVLVKDLLILTVCHAKIINYWMEVTVLMLVLKVKL